MRNKHVGTAGHSDGRNKVHARIYRTSFILRKAQISETSVDKRGDMACESDDASEAEIQHVPSSHEDIDSQAPSNIPQVGDMPSEKEEEKDLDVEDIDSQAPSNIPQVGDIPGEKGEEKDLDVKDIDSQAPSNIPRVGDMPSEKEEEEDLDVEDINSQAPSNILQVGDIPNEKEEEEDLDVEDIDSQAPSNIPQLGDIPSEKEEEEDLDFEDIDSQAPSNVPQLGDIPSGKEKEEDLDVEHELQNGTETAIEQSTFLQGSLATEDGTLRFKEYWVPVRLSNFQLEQYCSTLASNCAVLCSGSRCSYTLQDIVTALKKCCDHPYVLDPTMEHSARAISNDALSAGIEVGGKVQLLSKFLPNIKKQQLRVLILYKTIDVDRNPLKIGYILDDFICRTFGDNAYIHIYGGAYLASKKLQTNLDLFNGKDSEKFVVLVEHSRSFRGIKLSSVDIVILFNSSWNPGSDIKSLQQMNIETKSNQLRVFRLYSLSTLEEKTLVLAKKGRPVTVTSPLNRNLSHQLLMWGVPQLFTKLSELHGPGVPMLASSPKTDFLQSLLLELSIVMSSSSEDDSIRLISHMKKGGDGHYEDIWLYDEHTFQTLDEDLPHLFWPGFLKNKSFQWKYLPKTSGTRKRRISSPTFDQTSINEDIPSRKRSDRSEKLSPKQRQGEWGTGVPVNFDMLTGSSQSYRIDDGDMEESCKKRTIGENDQEGVIQKHFTAKEKGKILEDKHEYFQSKVISSMCDGTTKEEELKGSDKDSPDEQKHEMDKYCHEEASAQTVTTGDIHHGQTNVSSLPVTSSEPDSLPVCRSIVKSEVDLRSKRNDQNIALSGSRPCSDPIKSTIHLSEIVPQQKATLSPSKGTSIERDVYLDSDEEEQVGEPKNPMNSANADSGINQPSHTDTSTVKPSLKLLKGKIECITVDSDDEQKEAELVPDSPEVETVTGVTNLPLSSGNEQVSPTRSPTALNASSAKEEGEMMGTRPEKAPCTPMEQIQHASSGQHDLVNAPSELQLGSSLRTDDTADAGQNPFLSEVERLRKELVETEKNIETLVINIKSARERELAELKRHYETSLQEVNNEFLRNRTERIERYEKACANALLAKALRQANCIDMWESEVRQVNPCLSSFQMLQLSSPLPAPATHLPPVNTTGATLGWSSNNITEPFQLRFDQLSQNPNMHHNGNHQPVHTSHVSAPYVHPLDPRWIPGFEYPSSSVLLGGQAFNFPRGSVTSPDLHQPTSAQYFGWNR